MIYKNRCKDKTKGFLAIQFLAENLAGHVRFRVLLKVFWQQQAKIKCCWQPTKM
jgi:hypothetical protein